MSWKVTRAALIVAVALLCAQAEADEGRGGEAGFVTGVFVPDEPMTGASSTAEFSLGVRGGAVFTRHWGWFVDALYSRVATENGLGRARTTIGRTGVDYLFQPEREMRWFVSGGVGWMVVDYEDAATADFHNPLVALGFGQRIRVGNNTRLRWELRADHTLDDARLADDLVQGHALLAFVWGPAGAPKGEVTPTGADRYDADGDGVRDRRDRCAATPQGAEVGHDGCPLDDDRDGIPNGLDRCPGTRTSDVVGPNGCPSDRDGDGIPDVTDVCDETPAGALVNEWGCPQDADGDSVHDGLDGCAGTPFGARVDARGCPIDADGDGIYDGLDRCAETPSRTPVDSTGCPIDTDGDGVHDGIDRCPDTPSETRVVDARGCPRAPTTPSLFQPGRTEAIVTGVAFELNSATLTPASHIILNRIAGLLLSDGTTRVEIGGYTDSSGDDAYNLTLSQRRAEAVQAYLIERGVAADRLVARGYGEARPIADNGSADGRARNRRVELRPIVAADR
jgi:outer membrane protein OmpA-like peptidoglycan-associated protein